MEQAPELFRGGQKGPKRGQCKHEADVWPGQGETAWEELAFKFWWGLLNILHITWPGKIAVTLEILKIWWGPGLTGLNVTPPMARQVK